MEKLFLRPNAQNLSESDLQTDLVQLNSQLEERRRNLRVIDELIEADPKANKKLLEVREFLARRINIIERELAAVN